MKSLAATLLCLSLLLSRSTFGETITEGENTMRESCMLAADSMPESPAYPALLSDAPIDMNDEAAVNAFNAWWDAWQSWQKAPTPQREALFAFFQKCMTELAAERETRNPGVSPLSLALALDTLCDLAEGEGVRELTAALGYDSSAPTATGAPLGETLRWDDGETACIPGASLWLCADAKLDTDKARALAETRHISVYRCVKNEELRAWAEAWTKGRYGGQVLPLGENGGSTILSSLYVSARWVSPFSALKSAEGVFHTPEGDVPAVYLHSECDGVLYLGRCFTACSFSLGEMGEVLFLLPENGEDPTSLLAEEETIRFLSTGRDWEKRNYAWIHAAVPKLDMLQCLSAKDLLRRMELPAIFDQSASHESDALWLGDLLQLLPLSLDEWGVNAAPLELDGKDTGMMPSMPIGIQAPSEQVAEFTLNRPFLWAILGRDKLPLYVGIINDPTWQ